MNEAPRKADPELVKAIARESAEFLQNRAYTTASRALHLQCIGRLMDESLTDEQMRMTVAELRVVENFARRLASAAHDVDFAQGAQRVRRT
jgi:hypothetical protein